MSLLHQSEVKTTTVQRLPPRRSSALNATPPCRAWPPPPPFGALLQQALLEGREVAKAPFSGGGGAALRSPLDWLPRLGHLGPEIHHGGE